MNKTSRGKPKEKIKIPQEVIKVGKELDKKNFQAYLVGGSVRDFLLGKKIEDWDITTDALPEEIVKIFPDSYYNNKFGTVGIKTDNTGVIEVTTFRKESKYDDSRHPSKVVFTKSIDEDLTRRDFTINSLAINLKDLNKKFFKDFKHGKKIIKFEDSVDEKKENEGPGIEGDNKQLFVVKRYPKKGYGEFPSLYIPIVKFSKKEKEEIKKVITDNFSGIEDLEKKLIRTVGDPNKRFSEDALRLLRAVRFSVATGFKIEKETAKAISKNAHLLKKISRERIQDEFKKIILSSWPAEGVELMRRLGLLKYVAPMLEEGVGIEQNWHHLYSVYKHCILSLKFCFSEELEVRLASLFHDVGKPKVKKQEKDHCTFYFHEVEGEKITRKQLKYLKFPNDVIEETALLVRYHMFNFDPNEHNEGTVRRILYRVGGIERMQKLLILRVADRLGSGCHQGEVFKLRKLRYLIDKVSHDPISLSQLKVNGEDLMKNLKFKPGPHIGLILDILLARIIEKPEMNKKKDLLKLARDLWNKEKKNSGNLKKEASIAKKVLRGKKRDRELDLQSKYGITLN